jgi:hypothetical protein
MAVGYFIGLGDRTSCSGNVLDAATSMMMFRFARAREETEFCALRTGKPTR